MSNGECQGTVRRITSETSDEATLCASKHLTLANQQCFYIKGQALWKE